MLALALPAAAHADAFTDLVQPSVDGMYAAGAPPAMVVAVVRGDDTYLQGFGETAPGSGIVPDARSLVRIASLSKLFTSDVLAAMAEEGRVTLGDTLQARAPAGRLVPLAKNAAPITLLNLATHTGGLPREAPEPRWDWLEKVKLKPAGLSASYSNVGFDLLSDALAEAGGAPYPVLLERYTTAPLGMVDTTPSPTADQCARLIVGGLPERPCEDQSVMAGGGGLYSTAADMAAWMRFQLDSADLAAAGRRLTAQRIYIDRDDLKETVGLDHAGKASGIGLAWILLEMPNGGPHLLEKTGNIGGFLSYIALAPEAQAGVFVSIARPPDVRASARGVIRGVNALTAALASGNLYTASVPLRGSPDRQGSQ